MAPISTSTAAAVQTPESTAAAGQPATTLKSKPPVRQQSQKLLRRVGNGLRINQHRLAGHVCALLGAGLVVAGHGSAQALPLGPVQHPLDLVHGITWQTAGRADWQAGPAHLAQLHPQRLQQFIELDDPLHAPAQTVASPERAQRQGGSDCPAQIFWFDHWFIQLLMFSALTMVVGFVLVAS